MHGIVESSSGPLCCRCKPCSDWQSVRTVTSTLASVPAAAPEACSPAGEPSDTRHTCTVGKCLCLDSDATRSDTCLCYCSSLGDAPGNRTPKLKRHNSVFIRPGGGGRKHASSVGSAVAGIPNLKERDNTERRPPDMRRAKSSMIF